jgi:hypothetical protein
MHSVQCTGCTCFFVVVFIGKLDIRRIQWLGIRPNSILIGSVAEPEPVEQQLFAGAGAKVFMARSGSRAGYVNSYKMFQKP